MNNIKNNRRYAGITDKNDKQIFEGDILRATVWSNGELITFDAVVQYNNGEFWLKSLESPAIYHFCSIVKTRSEFIRKQDCRGCKYFVGCECFDGQT